MTSDEVGGEKLLGNWHTLLTIAAMLVAAGTWVGTIEYRVQQFDNKEPTDVTDALNAIENARRHALASIYFPVGSILAFAGPIENIPDGWLPCEGQTLIVKDHRALYKIIGTHWGGENDKYFNAPDLQGRFIRGVSGESNRDDGADTRAVAAIGGNSGNSVGSVQSDLDNTITEFQTLDWSSNSPGFRSAPIPAQGWSDHALTGEGGAEKAKAHIRFRISNNEVRPENANVIFIIRDK